jgi:hypothetical protein
MEKIRMSGCVNVAQVRRQMKSKAKKSGPGEVNKITSILRVQAHKGDTKAWVFGGILLIVSSEVEPGLVEGENELPSMMLDQQELV